MPNPAIDNRLDEAQHRFYEQAGTENEYTIEPGVMLLPVAGTSEAPVIVRVHSPYRRRTVRYTAKKSTTPPVLPCPTDAGPFTFLGGTLSAPFPSLNTDGRAEWAVSTEFEYVENMAFTQPETTGYVLGSLPFALKTQELRTGTFGYISSSESSVVGQAGITARTGANIEAMIDLTDPNNAYDEPAYLPASFLSTALVLGPANYMR